MRCNKVKTTFGRCVRPSARAMTTVGSVGESTHTANCRPFCFQLEQTIKGRLVSGRMVSTKASVFARIRPHAEKGGHAARKTGEHPKNVDVKKLGKFDSEGIMMYGGTGEKHFDYMERVIQPQEDQVRTHQTTFHAFLLYRSQRTNPWVFPLCLTASLTATM